MHLLSRFSLRNRALIALVTVVIGLFGAVALQSLKLELFPSISLPQVIITASYPGASPAVVENDVATPIENAIQGIPGLSSTSATSGSGIALVRAEFDYGTDLVYAEQKIQLAMNSLASQLPEGVSPQASTFSIDDFPIIQLAVTSELDANEVTDRLETLVVPELQALDGVAEATITGGAVQRVVVTPDFDKLEDYHLTQQAIVDALGTAGILLAVGEITEDGRSLTVQAGTKIESLDDIRDLPVLGGFTLVEAAPALPGYPPSVTQKDKRLQIDELATVEIVDAPVESISRVGGQPAITIGVTKTPDGNTVEVSHAVRDALPELAALVGTGTVFTVVFDQAPSVEASIETLTTEGLLGLGFAILVILLFLFSIRSTLVTAISIPASVLITFIGMWATGYSMNMLTLGAITISIGRVVDDSIVVIENIKHHLASGEEKLKAILQGVREVATAVTASTVTTVAVFLPIAFVTDITGELFRPFALTVTIALVASLFVSLTIVPVLAYWFLKAPKAKEGAELAGVSTASTSDRGLLAALDAKPDRLQRAYLPIIRWTLRFPWITFVLSLLVLGGTGYAAQFMQTNFVAGGPENSISITQTIDAGSDLATKDAAATVVEQALLDVPGVDVVQVSIGGSSVLGALFGSSSDATFSVTTGDGVDAEGVKADIRETLDGLDPAEVGDLSVGSTGGGFSSDVTIGITAADEEALADATQQVLDAVQALDVTAEASSNLSVAQPYISITVDRIQAAKHNLSEVMIGRIVAQAMNPGASSDFELDGRNIDIYLQHPDKPLSVAELEGFEFTAPDGDDLELRDVAAVAVVDGPTSITTERGIRTAEVTVVPATQDTGTAGTEITAAVDALALPAGTTAGVGGVVSDQQNAFAQLGLAMLAAILIVYTIMVATFRSLRQPLLLLVSIPFAATGAIVLQIISGVPLGAASLIGALMLIGIVVTNAIVLVDLINQFREQGVKARLAVETGAARRLRPILMTALATILALTPMGLGLTGGGGGFISQPLAITVIGGLVSSTLLTLIVLPTLYYLVEGAKERRQDRRAARGAANDGPDPSLAERLADGGAGMPVVTTAAVTPATVASSTPSAPTEPAAVTGQPAEMRRTTEREDDRIPPRDASPQPNDDDA